MVPNVDDGARLVIIKPKILVLLIKHHIAMLLYDVIHMHYIAKIGFSRITPANLNESG